MKNRKKAESYRFNGVSGIEPVQIEELERWVDHFRFKLRWRNDWDDKRWVARWLCRFERELEKKQRSRERKREERDKRR